jgi:hypothetical protein
MRADPSANAAIEPDTEIFPSMFVSFRRLPPPFGRVRYDGREIAPRRGGDKYDFDMRVSAAEIAASVLPEAADQAARASDDSCTARPCSHLPPCVVFADPRRGDAKIHGSARLRIDKQSARPRHCHANGDFFHHSRIRSRNAAEMASNLTLLPFWNG